MERMCDKNSRVLSPSARNPFSISSKALLGDFFGLSKGKINWVFPELALFSTPIVSGTTKSRILKLNFPE
ncbi:MAG: hypothetical protein OQK12_16670 [Motiliproteus sp.]|nr:hypothetical protein [Motiliproteus sp.]MCW9053900.1 hypothetical protein [Motiliproteus sp.]